MEINLQIQPELGGLGGWGCQSDDDDFLQIRLDLDLFDSTYSEIKDQKEITYFAICSVLSEAT